LGREQRDRPVEVLARPSVVVGANNSERFAGRHAESICGGGCTRSAQKGSKQSTSTLPSSAQRLKGAVEAKRRRGPDPTPLASEKVPLSVPVDAEPDEV